MAEVLATVLPNAKPGAKSADFGFREGLLGMMWLKVDADPSLSGVAAPVGSLASWDDSGAGTLFLKVGTGDTDWTALALVP